MQRQDIEIRGQSLETYVGGSGPPLVFLHGGDHFTLNLPFLDLLATQFRVVAPRHPGFGQTPQPAAIRTTDDLAYFYLDVFQAIGLTEAALVGASFGGWLAMEICVRSNACLSSLTLIDTLGLKFGPPEEREIADLYALSEEDILARSYAEPARWGPDYPSLPEQEVEEIAQDRIALTQYGWRPYMHNPRLRHWLHRIDRPTLVLWGEADGIVSPVYGRRVAEAIPGAEFALVPGTAHHPQIEDPEAVADAIRDHAAAAASAAGGLS